MVLRQIKFALCRNQVPKNSLSPERGEGWGEAWLMDKQSARAFAKTPD
jgi:hypothetical protein